VHKHHKYITKNLEFRTVVQQFTVQHSNHYSIYVWDSGSYLNCNHILQYYQINVDKFMSHKSKPFSTWNMWLIFESI